MITLFTSYNALLEPLVEHTASSHATFAFHNDRRPKLGIGLVRIRSVSYSTFGIEKVFFSFGSETAIPAYIKRFYQIVSEINPNKIVVLDFHKLLFVQCVLYKKRNPSCKLYLYSETKSWPTNLVTKFGMKVFFWYLKRNIGLVEKILVYTRQGEDFFRKNLPEAHVVLCPAPVDTKLFYPDPNKEFLKDGVLRILMNARFVKYKRHDDLLQVLHTLKNKNVTFELSLVGRGGHMEEKIKQKVKELGLSEQVTFLPAVSIEKMRDYYITHDLLILPSASEAIGMAVPEAMACGIPTITSDTVGSNVYVQEGETGLIFKTGDVEDLACKIESMDDPSKLSEFGKASERVIAERFSIEQMGAHFSKALDIL